MPYTIIKAKNDQKYLHWRALPPLKQQEYSSLLEATYRYGNIHQKYFTLSQFVRLGLDDPLRSVYGFHARFVVDWALGLFVALAMKDGVYDIALAHKTEE